MNARTEMWARPDWSEVLAAWGMADTGLRPPACSIDACEEPKASLISGSVCMGHYQERQREYRRARESRGAA